MTGHSLAPAGEGDVGEIARIHALSFDDPWSGPVLRRILSMTGAAGMVARSDLRQDVAGFALLRLAADECELLTIAVAPERRGRGVGAQLLDAVMERAAGAGARRVFLEVAEDNHAARGLYGARGFRVVGRRPGYYRRPAGPPAAALTMARRLG